MILGTVWKLSKPDRSESFKFDNTTGARLTDYSKDLMSPMDAFRLLFSGDAADIMIRYTNKHGESDPDWTEMDAKEFDAFIAIFIVIGQTKSRKRSISSLWSSNYFFRIAFFSTVMARNRFSIILKHWRFDDSATRAQRLEETGDRLIAIRDVYEIFRKNCMRAYEPSAIITIDERLIVFRGRCGHFVWIPSKPGKGGQKEWIAADASTCYVCNMQLYYGGKNLIKKTLITKYKFKHFKRFTPSV